MYLISQRTSGSILLYQLRIYLISAQSYLQSLDSLKEVNWRNRHRAYQFIRTKHSVVTFASKDVIKEIKAMEQSL